MAAPLAEADPAAQRKVVCIGFMGAGKSTAAQSAAQALSLAQVDVDRVIEERLGKSIDRVFAEDGEAKFRAVEEKITLELLASPRPQVLALGGGAIGHERVRAALADHVVVWLDVGLDIAWARCHGSDRPLAQDQANFERLFHEREPIYAGLADVTVPAERSHRMEPILAAHQNVRSDIKLLWAATAGNPAADYPVYVGRELLGFWPEAVAGRRFLVTDGAVGRVYGDRLGQLSGRVAVMPGEQSKTVAHAEIVWTELARAGMTRQDVVVALGGGVVGDLAGFCAATYQRGVRYVQVPTTLVAQVDSAYGGKTGVDLAEAKNYVGAFHQPSAVITDPATLETLPPAELAAGYAEVLKTALIAGGDLWDRIRQGADPTDPDLIAACALTKLRIVARDERDAGIRQVLNLGHTVGHAIETVTGYASYRHGEAVALGLLAVLRLSEQHDLRQEVEHLLETHDLPTHLEHAEPDAVVMATARDKKRVGEGSVPFVLLDAPGAPRTGCAVEPRALIAAVRELAV
ncbi:MAG TPA: bifunctional shikimate kinase/3-dehydroquinate synthase [Solirubrobacteraceae bacterium]|nr:bifunctional shikimate kinase/3-dehydroquinate synthase [Solirubrobacteraceae bacterium]